MKMHYVGIDLGTSGCRLTIIDHNQNTVFETSIRYPSQQEQSAELWWQAVIECFTQCPQIVKKDIRAISLDGTSGTILLCDAQGNPTSSVLMYNDLRANEEAEFIKTFLPEDNGGQGASGSLARLFWLLKHEAKNDHFFALHQADYILGKLAGTFGISDENNCLKLGYDAVKQCWPQALLDQLGERAALLPKVIPAGRIFSKIDSSLASQLRLPNSVKIVSGTTDSIAAFIATGANQLSEAVTSLGSSLVIKQISNNPIYKPALGIYSHRLVIDNNPYWLVGGSSNSGGNVLRHYFSLEALKEMTPSLQPESTTGLDYYPLVEVGERFPEADVNKQPRLEPRPSSDVEFFQGIIEGIASIEKQGYDALKQLGAGDLISVRSVGGGSKNDAWTTIRGNQLQVPMIRPLQTEASYGAALLALRAE